MASGVDDILLTINENILDQCMKDYVDDIEKKADKMYTYAALAREKGLDHTELVEIPRAADLASRTEKLLIEYLDGELISDEIRELLLVNDRETTAIEMAQRIARRFKEKNIELKTCVDVGVRVGLAILTEAVLVAPLEGISEIKILNNIDGSTFASIHFTGPIRAAGGTGQALAVLITDMIRRDLGIGRYVPTDAEVERVKEEFGLYRVGLQYKPSPEEIDEIVRACPIMINGEQTEKIECSGYGVVRNIEGPRIRGGVLLVIGEGLCLKAPKIMKHTERIGVPGWDFISKFAKKGKSKDKNSNSKVVEPITKYMSDLVAGRPIFGGPSKAGGFRLRYGRSRTSGLAAASINPASMSVMDDFLTVGTQLKIERPGKSTAVTPCDEIEGPWVLMEDKSFFRIDSQPMMDKLRNSVSHIWDNGEILFGFGEFLENNKNLVPVGYSIDWWASELFEKIKIDDNIEKFATICKQDISEFPSEEIHNELDAKLAIAWNKFLRRKVVNWKTAKALAIEFNLSLPPPHNPWWADLPLEWVPNLIKQLSNSTVIERNDNLIKYEGTKPVDQELWLSVDENNAENDILPETIFNENNNLKQYVADFGFLKTSIMLLGLKHHHNKNQLIITSGWESLLEGLRFEFVQKIGSKPLPNSGINDALIGKIDDLLKAKEVISKENARKLDVESKKRIEKIRAETEARQKGLSISETEKAGILAMDEIIDEGPENKNLLIESFKLKDENIVKNSLWIVKKLSDIRWESSVPTRIGCRMGRPEKANKRTYKNAINSLFPIGEEGGPQSLMSVASSKNPRVILGVRTCTKCNKNTPFIRCHHEQNVDGKKYTCNGKTAQKENGSNKKRNSEMQTIYLDKKMEIARKELGLDRIPRKIKCIKELRTKSKTPESINKGILRAKHGLPVYKDGTIRFDMSDVPLTHFTPREINADWKKLREIGYTLDINGNPLESNRQMLELFPQDFVLSDNCANFMYNVANYVDELLERHYKMDKWYKFESKDDLIGELIIALAPHTSGGVLGRIIGWSNCSGGYAHPLFHAAKRRNCDGDEDCVMMLMDGLLNFSRKLLPAGRGGLMDAPLVLTTRINPNEVDKEALNVDAAWYYPPSLYFAAKELKNPKDIINEIDIVEHRKENVTALRGYGFTHFTNKLDTGPEFSAYKTLDTMVDKMNGQLSLGKRIRAVDAKNVASLVVRNHFLPDLRGNLQAFTKQKVRCTKCNHSYRRMPIAGKCIQIMKGRDGGLVGSGSRIQRCNGNIALTVSQGAVRKYIKVINHIQEEYGLDIYTNQNVKWLIDSTDSLFNNDRAKQMSLSDFL